jgi:hypothetical protein
MPVLRLVGIAAQDPVTGLLPFLEIIDEFSLLAPVLMRRQFWPLLHSLLKETGEHHDCGPFCGNKVPSR